MAVKVRGSPNVRNTVLCVSGENTDLQITDEVLCYITLHADYFICYLNSRSFTKKIDIVHDISMAIHLPSNFPYTWLIGL